MPPTESPLTDADDIHKSRFMDNESAAAAFSAMGHPSRIAILRYLVECGGHGADATTLAAELGIAWTTLNHHLDHLKRAGVVVARRDGRRMVHRADIQAVSALSSFLMENCCTRAPKEMADEAPACAYRRD